MRLRFPRFFRSLTFRMMLSHMLVASLTAVIAILVLAVIYSIVVRNVNSEDYRALAIYSAVDWLFGGEDGLPNHTEYGMPNGFTLVVSPDDEVLFSQGDTGCRAGMRLAECAPELEGLPTQDRFFERDGQRWSEVVLETIGEERIIAQRGPFESELTLIVGDFVLYGTAKFILFMAAVSAGLSIPVSVLLAWLLARRQIRRLSSMAQISRHFAGGDLTVRVHDSRQDEVGKLAQQFDDMADALEQNIHALRDLAQRNTELAQQAEQAAIQAERIRISRDLHDAIAQRLFSLSVSTSTLPELIQKDQEKGVQQAQSIADLAEHTLLDLRALLMELRPTSVLQHGLTDAIRTLCVQWQAAHNISAECSLMLTGKYIPAPVEDIIYRVTQESLSNVAKHAHATLVEIALVEGQRQITLSVTDNGTGFDLDHAGADGKFGLVSMRERANTVGGMLTVESEMRRGTTIQMVLPLERNGKL